MMVIGSQSTNKAVASQRHGGIALSSNASVNRNISTDTTKLISSDASTYKRLDYSNNSNLTTGRVGEFNA